MRALLLPFSLIYKIITDVRNFLYDKKLLPSTSFMIPIIGIGNLSVGGTGKSPHTLYIANLLQEEFQIGILSRGYKRKTKGFKVANYSSTYLEIGDEPLQAFLRFKNRVIIAVSKNRKKGIKNLLKKYNLEAIILDDAFQHRKVKPSLNILLTDSSHLFIEDYLLPAGNLRESRWGSKRADIVIVTKVPEDITQARKDEIKNSLGLLHNQKLFFSSINYPKKIYSLHEKIDIENLDNYEVLLVTGIAQATPIVEYIKPKVKKFQHLHYKDHHAYSEKDISKIEDQFTEFNGKKIILTTEKDFMRLKSYSMLKEYLFYLPIDIRIHNSEVFNQLILDHVRKN